jgi:TonB family protein
MPITQTPSRDPLTSPPKVRSRESVDFYDARDWESAYRFFDQNAVPQLLLHLQDDLARSRRREAAWLSVILHLLVVLLFVNLPRLQHRNPAMLVSLQDQMKGKELTFLALPPDVQQITKPKDTNIISDKNRVATSRNPQLDPKELKKILDSARPGRPGPAGPQSPSQQPTPPAIAENIPGPASQQPGQQNVSPAPQFQSQNQAAQIQAPPTAAPPKPNVKFGSGGYVGSQIDQAARGVAANRGGGGEGGDFGTNLGNGASTSGQMEVLSDTMGVDFGPYLNRVLQVVRQNWYILIPEVARPPIMKQGKVAIEFAILKDGNVAGMKLVGPSGDVALDRAAYGSITNSNPFQPLPREFGGQYLALRFYYYYNMDVRDLH